MGETISLLVGGLVVENFDGHWIRISILAERIQTATDDDTKKLVTALWDARADQKRWLLANAKPNFKDADNGE